MTDAAIGPYAPRVDGPSEPRLPSRHPRLEPGLLDAGVYSSRRLAPLTEAVPRAIGIASREEAGRGGLEIEPLWQRPELRARLVQALVDHAARSGAGRVVAADHTSLALASPVAGRLGLSLERRRDGDDSPPRNRPGEPGRGGGPYLVACVLQDREAGRFLRDPAGGGRPTGVGAVIRIRAPEKSPSTSDRRILSIIDL